MLHYQTQHAETSFRGWDLNQVKC